MILYFLIDRRFSTKESATHAIVAVHNTDINGQTVKCSWGKESGDPNNAQQTGQVKINIERSYNSPMGVYRVNWKPTVTTAWLNRNSEYLLSLCNSLPDAHLCDLPLLRGGRGGRGSSGWSRRCRGRRKRRWRRWSRSARLLVPTPILPHNSYPNAGSRRFPSGYAGIHIRPICWLPAGSIHGVSFSRYLKNF